MAYRPLGRTGVEVSAVSLGTGSLGEMFGPLPEADALSLVDEALDAGINLVDTSPYYCSAEERLGKALTPAKRDGVVLATKAGRYGPTDFDFSPARIRRSLEESLRRLGTDHVDVLQLHDVEFVDLDPVLSDSVAELLRLREEGKCRFIGITGYPLGTFTRVLTEAPVDVVLTYAKGTLLDDSLTTDLLPLAEARGIGVMNAAAVALGLLSRRGTRFEQEHPAPEPVRRAAAAMVALAEEAGVDLAFLANQYAVQRSGAPTTVVGVGRREHLRSALDAVRTPIDQELLDRFLALRPPPDRRRWRVGLPQNA
ncbi:aldo/keto reductase [Nocardioides sp. YIM 152588]|uniref:aldo/keto reductase n=1 Tax=Nocardioides sp. YIM 152588 TaxID=3158259 RepID=UPI0032E38183